MHDSIQPSKIWDEGDLDYVKNLIRGNPKWLHWKDGQGRSLLHFAAKSGNARIVEFLIGQGAPVNATDQHRLTAAYEAISCGSVECLKALVEAGIDISLRDGLSGFTSLVHAARRGRTDMCQFLVSKGAADWRSIEVAEGMKNFDTAEALRQLQQEAGNQSSVSDSDAASPDSLSRLDLERSYVREATKYHDENNYGKALEFVDKAIALNQIPPIHENVAQIWIMKSAVLSHLGRSKECVDAYLTAKKIDPLIEKPGWLS